VIPELHLVSLSCCSVCDVSGLFSCFILDIISMLIHLDLLLRLNALLSRSRHKHKHQRDPSRSQNVARPRDDRNLSRHKPTAKNFIFDGGNLLSVRRMIRSVRFINALRPGFGALSPVLPSDLLMKTFKSIHSSPLA